MRIVTLVVIALLITGISFADDRLDQVPAMSGKVEIMDQLGLIQHADPTARVMIPPRKKTQKAAPPVQVRIHHLADIMTDGD
ncbi:MAG: hypothetical protein JSU04_19240 [Bdellovibrionales bacterium]|nr:hypothetical protein [Bdellovibrionales bacterium]